eukprot:1196222-Prorocentrum_minimum.AAC.1
MTKICQSRVISFPIVLLSVSHPTHSQILRTNGCKRDKVGRKVHRVHKKSEAGKQAQGFHRKRMKPVVRCALPAHALQSGSSYPCGPTRRGPVELRLDTVTGRQVMVCPLLGFCSVGFDGKYSALNPQTDTSRLKAYFYLGRGVQNTDWLW